MDFQMNLSRPLKSRNWPQDFCWLELYLHVSSEGDLADGAIFRPALSGVTKFGHRCAKVCGCRSLRRRKLIEESVIHGCDDEARRAHTSGL
jgi:hypothetical protein